MQGDGGLIGFDDGSIEVRVFKRAEVVDRKVPFERGCGRRLGRLGLFARVEVVVRGL